MAEVAPSYMVGATAFIGGKLSFSMIEMTGRRPYLPTQRCHEGSTKVRSFTHEGSNNEHGCAHLPMSTSSGATVSLRLHPARRRFQPPPSLVVVILAAGDPTYSAVHCWRSCVSGGWKPPLEQSAALRHLSFNADCFPEPPQNSSRFPITSFLTVFGFWVLYTVYSNGLAVLYSILKPV